MSNQITCAVNSQDASRITHVGGVAGETVSGYLTTGSRFKLSEAAVIRLIRGGSTFFVEKIGKRVKVVIGTLGGHDYLKTENDSTTNNNLRSLPDCK